MTDPTSPHQFAPQFGMGTANGCVVQPERDPDRQWLIETGLIWTSLPGSYRDLAVAWLIRHRDFDLDYARNIPSTVRASIELARETS